MPRAGDSDVRRWIERYFNDCVCSVRGELSFGLGMISLFCWGIAEVPQIITNFHNKSGHGLPTQFYTALLYTAVTVVLVVQILYYDFWLRCCKSKGFAAQREVIDTSTHHLHPMCSSASPRTDVCYTYVRLLGFHCLPDEPKQVLVLSKCRFARVCRSARSLASSGTPPCRSSYLGPARSGPSASGYMESSGSDDERSPRHRSWRSGMSKPSRILYRSFDMSRKLPRSLYHSKPKLQWRLFLLFAACSSLTTSFYQIILQFAYYKFVHKRMTSNEDEHEDLMEAKKTFF
ncbi:hypothetical protein B296_00056138 [Ensete ventricosum]|uniref:Uncharacterized protein n=1 Tax=Ensete ventricosum TaxID=4639 RepID=A0A426XED7_ENSVE|nr:hypothetical protein B296_00056138 [Ensete ventricosum]